VPHPTDNKLSRYVEARDLIPHRRLRNRLLGVKRGNQGTKPLHFRCCRLRCVDELLTEQEVADYCKVSVRTVKRWRAEGTGPPFLRAGRQVRYRKRDVDAWLESRGQQNEP
jgi:excisionase family DNA binding protein